MSPSLTLAQAGAGYRYNRDSFILADFFRPRGSLSMIDLGAGAGVVSILIGMDNPGLEPFAVEINPALASAALWNARRSGLARYHVIAADMLRVPDILGSTKFGAVVSNPPYYKAGAGRLCADPARAAARHETKMTLEGLARTASRLLAEGGTMTISMIPERRGEYEKILESAGFHEIRYREIIPVPGGPPNVFLSEARLGGDGEEKRVVEPPLTLRTPEGEDSAEYRKIAVRYA
ncbi:MAG: tRNA1(Val) (adenine(37)-N6)-methyltransferase [Candidatus Nitrospinota bacterium M3_3B_026]